MFLPQFLMLCWNLLFCHWSKKIQRTSSLLYSFVRWGCLRSLLTNNYIKLKVMNSAFKTTQSTACCSVLILLVLLTECLNDTFLIFHPGHGTCFPTTPPANHPYLGHQLWPRCVLLMSQAIVAREKPDSFRGCFHETTSRHYPLCFTTEK